MERTSRTFLEKETPIIIRVNARPFPPSDKTVTQPSEAIWQKAMRKTLLALCHHIQGCCLGYTFGDEISFLLFQHEGKTVWFDGDTEKITSSVAGLATLTFYKKLMQCISKAEKKSIDEKTIQHFYFSANAFNLPLESVDDYFLWRQNECIRKSVASVVLTLPGMDSKKIQGKPMPQLLKILEEKGKSWENLPVQNRYGTFAVRQTTELARYEGGHIKSFIQNGWEIYPNTPRLYFKKSPFVMTQLVHTNSKSKRR